MADTGWSNASFTPEGKKEFPLKDVRLTFPSVTEPLDPKAPDYLEDVIGPIGIRVEALKAGDIPIFDEGTTGTFSATLQGQIQHSTNNAVVVMSDNQRLVLSATSFDGSTSPRTFTRST
jgi:hypothetical protein